MKLVDAATGRDILVFYVEGGKRFQIDVPLGQYQIKYAAGETWYGENNLFGPETAYEKTDKTFDFYVSGNQISGYTVELISQINGNLGSGPINFRIPEQIQM